MQVFSVVLAVGPRTGEDLPRTKIDHTKLAARSMPTGGDADGELRCKRC